MKVLMFLTAAIPSVALVILWWAKPELIFLGGEADSAQVWTVFGTVFGYFGFIFACYAAFAVEKISGRYFAKAVLPEIRRNLAGITGKMASMSGERLEFLRTQSFMPEISVALRSVRRTKVSSLKPIAKRAVRGHGKLQKLIMSENKGLVVAHKSSEFWALHSVLSELEDEIRAHISESEARQ